MIKGAYDSERTHMQEEQKRRELMSTHNAGVESGSVSSMESGSPRGASPHICTHVACNGHAAAHMQQRNMLRKTEVFSINIWK